jgi:hypothetical protein
MKTTVSINTICDYDDDEYGDDPKTVNNKTNIFSTERKQIVNKKDLKYQWD